MKRGRAKKCSKHPDDIDDCVMFERDPNKFVGRKLRPVPQTNKHVMQNDQLRRRSSETRMIRRLLILRTWWRSGVIGILSVRMRMVCILQRAKHAQIGMSVSTKRNSRTGPQWGDMSIPRHTPLDMGSRSLVRTDIWKIKKRSNIRNGHIGVLFVDLRRSRL